MMLTGIFVPAVVAAASALHPFHVAIGEADLSVDGTELEVSLSVFGEDLEKALSLRHGREIDLEQTEGVGELIADYVAANWRWREIGAEEPERGWPASEIGWVGLEVEPRECWLYFTVGVPGELGELEMSLSVMFEVEPSQENGLTVRASGDKLSATFTPQAPWQRLAVPPEDD